MIEIWYIEKGIIKYFGVIAQDIKESLNINIPTKERIVNFDIFLFYQKFQKIYKISFNCSS